MNKEKALKWVQDRLVFIAENCNLKDEDNKKAYDVLTYIKETLEKQEELESLILELQERD